MSLVSLLAPLVDAPTLDLDAVGHVLVAEDADETSLDFERLLRLAGRLPSGLVHAESVWLTSVPPVGLAPLAPGSAWSALDRALIVTLPPGRSALVATAVDLARYALAADEVHRILGPQVELVDALLGGAALDVAAATRLALALGAEPELIVGLDRRAPGLRQDLGHMARRRFRPSVQLHPSTRPSRWRRLGDSIARRLLDALPAGPLRLVVADSADVVEHLSPYPRDVAPLLSAWAVENPHLVGVRGLVEALSTGRGATADHSTLVVRELVRAHAEVLEERRTVERAAGLELFDEAGMVFGYADVAHLPAPDPRALPTGSRGVLAVIAGPADEALLAAAAAMLESGRVEGLAVVARGGAELEGACAVPELLVAADDALVLDGASRVIRRAEALGLRVARPRRVVVDAERGAPPWAFALLRLMRRAHHTGLFPSEGRVSLALHARATPSGLTELEAALAGLMAARIGLVGLQLADPPPTARAADPAKGSASLRFRA